MLSLIELSQFQQTVHDFAENIHEFEYDDNMIESDTEWRIFSDFIIYPSSVPNSSIVYNDLQNEEIALCRHLGLKNRARSVSEDNIYSEGSLDTMDYFPSKRIVNRAVLINEYRDD
eukprot:TRINITY_DN6058_c0_g1_i1.p1 TRINITY_DN6058_c0_g1~~TRINITY_DN6058_c0_g1_i1.p1  ORF type:complete len:116 (+),score=25.45 TRINITY_DN6058_c0_g1_i1:210-557(+)